MLQHHDPHREDPEKSPASFKAAEKGHAWKNAQFLDLWLDAMTFDEMLRRIDAWLASAPQRSFHIATINANCTTLAIKNERLRNIYNGGDIVGVDGTPFLYWIRHVLRIPCDHLCAAEIILQLAEHAKDTNYRFYLYGGSPEVAVRMKESLESRFAHMRIVGMMSPPFRPLTREEDEKIVNEINALKPDIILVGLGTPKQDYWIEDHIYRIKGSVMLAAGATFDFFGGRVRMAPPFIRKSGFEWLYRLLSRDFFRLFKRYTILNVIFLWHFLLQLIGLRKTTGKRWTRTDSPTTCNPRTTSPSPL
jgi:N-acetylglucosaminyldiphosphoundecaprenol N-acetyl-beta-D-mannosaminyltransferase